MDNKIIGISEAYKDLAKYLNLDRSESFELRTHAYEYVIALYLSRQNVKSYQDVYEPASELIQALDASQYLRDRLKPLEAKIKALEEENSKLLETLTTGAEYLGNEE